MGDPLPASAPGTCRHAERAAGRGVEAEAAHPAVGHVLEIMGKCFAEPHSVGALARAAGISVSHLRHLFAAHMGVGIKQYATQLRVLKACEMLAVEPGLKIESVAQTVGFRYVADFNRAFMARMRLTPSEYRLANRTNRTPQRS